MQVPSPAVAAVFEPVQTATTLEETVERLGTAIRLGLLGPGDRLPPERELADQLGIARSTLRQALMSLTESGHLVAQRGRGGGTFVSEAPPLAERSRVELSDGHWRELLDYRIAVEVGAAVLAAERARPEDLEPLRIQVEAMRGEADFSAYRRSDVFFHLGIAEASRVGAAGGGDDRGPGQDERADRPHRASARRCSRGPTSSTQRWWRRSSGATAGRPPTSSASTSRAPSRSSPA